MNAGVLLVVGIVLIALGLQALRSLRSRATSFFAGRPTVRTLVLLGVGVILSVAGLWGLVAKT